jgi:hypothetical protein
LKSSISTAHCTVNTSIFQSHSKKIPFALLLLLPSFARIVQIQVATQFFMICPTSVCVLTAVLTLCFKLMPDSPDLLPEDSQLGAEQINAEERGATLQGHCGAAFQVAHRIAPFMGLHAPLSRRTGRHIALAAA